MVLQSGIRSADPGWVTASLDRAATPRSAPSGRVPLWLALEDALADVGAVALAPVVPDLPVPLPRDPTAPTGLAARLGPPPQPPEPPSLGERCVTLGLVLGSAAALFGLSQLGAVLAWLG